MWWVLILVAAVTCLFWYVGKCWNYWKDRGTLQPGFGTILENLREMFYRTKSQPDAVLDLYNVFPEARYYGSYVFITPVVFLRDPDLIRQITVKDFDYFIDHKFMGTDEGDPLWSKNLLGLKGEKWKAMRATLSPSFTSSKMKAMFALMSECAEKFANHFAGEIQGTGSYEMKDVFTRYANDVIASTAFGITCDSLAERDNEFYLMGKETTDFRGFVKGLKFFFMFTCPKLARMMGVRMFSQKASKFFVNLVRETVRVREEKGIVRPDMIHLLMEARKGKLRYEEHGESQKEAGFATVLEEPAERPKIDVHKSQLTELEMTAQVLIFFFAGFDTVSTAMSFMAYELAANKEIQDKLYEEIKETLNSVGGKLTYDALLKMKYLDMVVCETLRKWPPFQSTDRLCVKPYTIQPEAKGESAIRIEKGTAVFIPIYGIHRDEKYYPNPEKFDPERFGEENRKNLNPYCYMPFGVGPRNCIGSRFALLEVKAVFVHILSKLEIVPVEKTRIPMVLAKTVFNVGPEGGFWVGLKSRT